MTTMSDKLPKPAAVVPRGFAPAVRARLLVGFLLNAGLVPCLIPDFNASVAEQILRVFIACSISVVALVFLASVFLRRFTVWQAIVTGMLMLIPVFALTSGVMWLLGK